MIKLKNMFIFAPLKLGYSDGQGNVTERHFSFYEKINKNLGAITIEPLYMDKGLREIPTQLGIDSDDKIIGLQKLNEIIHQYGAKSIAHLNHPGRMSNPKIPGNFWWSSSNVACENGGAEPIEMNRKMMDEVIDLFVESSKRAVKAGFDIIELQFGHGYLMSQFISPMVNKRKDEYGGSFENRIKFPIEVAKAVIKSVDVPVIARISGDEMIPAGFHIDEMKEFSKKLEEIGIDAIHVSAGSVCSNPPWFFQHMFIPKGKTWELAGLIKDVVNIPVIFVGRVNSAKDIDFIKEKYNANYIAVGRSMVADTDFIGKYLGEVNGITRPCLACAEGCLGGVKSGKGLGCVVNPEVNNSLEFSVTTSPKKYAVIGGGLAGMQASITLRNKGHLVDLFEKDELGGQFNLAYLPPKKGSLKDIVDYYKEELSVDKGNKINVVFGEISKDKIKTGKYDAVILATGAIPAVPPIKGLKEYYWTEFLDDSQLPVNQKVLIIGGGLIGLEIASKLIDSMNSVVIVEMLDELAQGMEMIEKVMTLKKLKAKGVEIVLKHKVVEIADDKVTVLGEHGKKIISDIDRIVVATGMKSHLPFESIENIPIYIVGDAKKVGKAQDAIHDAYELALGL